MRIELTTPVVIPKWAFLTCVASKAALAGMILCLWAC